MKSSDTFKRFTAIVGRHIVELERNAPAHGSEEWYLLNHLRHLFQNASSSTSAREVANSVKSLAHFAVDSLDWNGINAKRVDEILSFHSSLLKAELKK